MNKKGCAAFLDGVSRIFDPMTRRNNYPKYQLRKPADALRSDWEAVGGYMRTAIQQYDDELSERARRKLDAIQRIDYIHALIAADAIDPDQAYFWTDEWQAAEREADEDIAAGRVKAFDTMDEFLADLISDE